MIRKYTLNGPISSRALAESIRDSLSGVQGVTTVGINADTKTVTLSMDDGVTLENLNAALKPYGNYSLSAEQILKPESIKNTLQDFAPFIIIISLIIIFTLLRQWYNSWNLYNAMNDFMGAFFIVFALFKIINWHSFAYAYSSYDIIAQKSILYAYAYPLIELALGIGYLTRWNPTIINSITLIIMSIGSIGVAKALMHNQHIQCACLGAVFKIPMTYVTLAEDLIMAIMALVMLLINR